MTLLRQARIRGFVTDDSEQMSQDEWTSVARHQRYIDFPDLCTL